MDDTQYQRATEAARKLGAERGTNAAAWYVQDTIGGRVSGDPEKAARYILRGIEDGDSAVTDGFPFCDLSGKWAGVPSGPEVYSEIMADADIDREDDESEYDAFTEILDEYERAFDQAAQDEIERAARAILTPETDA